MSETSQSAAEVRMPRYVALVATVWIGADGRRTLIAPGQPLPEQMSEHERQKLIAVRAARDNQQAQRQQTSDLAPEPAPAPAAPAKRKGAAQ